MWEATVGGRKLNFHLAGINNQNFIMRDEETGSWWQQVTGEAILGPLKGQRLRQVFHDELTFAIWKREQPQGRVLRPDERVARAGEYAPANWEERMANVPVATSSSPDAALAPRTLVIGITLNNASKAYPFDAVVRQSPIIDNVGGVPVLILIGDDKKSVRAFERLVDGRPMEFFVKQDGATRLLVDSETGSEWDFTGRATAGPLMGHELQRVAVLNDYWFDWVRHEAHTTVWMNGLPDR